MKKSLVKYLVCPLTQSPLELQPDVCDGAEVFEGRLVSREGRVYDVKRKVPQFLESATESAKVETEGSFSKKWNRAPHYGIHGATRDFHRSWFLERYGFKEEKHLQCFLMDKSTILDAGTGTGRNALWFGSLSPWSEIFAIDISEAVYHACDNTKHLENVHCIRGDITALPFQDGLFDYIVCDQVIHHTPNPRETFSHLVKKMRPGGEIGCYVYKKKGPIREFCDDYIRERTTRMTEEECLEFSKAITKLGQCLSDLDVEFEVPEDIPILDIKAGRYNLQRFFYWNVLKCFWNSEHGFNYSMLNNFDWYHPIIAWRYTPQEFRQWFLDHRIEIISEIVTESGISIHGRKI